MSLSVREKISYGLGDTASNFVFQSVVIMMPFFYTDIFGISAAVAGTLFLVVRIFDAVTDPLMGAIADRTHTRWGSYRPYLLWMAIPFGVITVLAFSTPDLSENGKVIYAFVTYTLLMAVYTAINTPYSALGGSLSNDPGERVSIQSYRFFFGMLGGLIITMFTLPMTEYLGEGDAAKGYQLTIGILSVIGVFLFFLSFAGTKERVFPPKTQKSRIRDDLRALWQNDQWRILCLIAVFVLTGIVMRAGTALHYLNNYLDVSAWLDAGWKIGTLGAAFTTVGMLGNLVGVSIASPITERMCKVRAYTLIQIVAIAISIASFFIAPDQLILAFVAYFAWSMVLQMGTPILWAFIADVVDYGQDKTGIRINGMTYSTVIFFIKLGVAFGGAMIGWALAYYGYTSGDNVTEETKEGILLLFTILPVIPFVLVVLTMRFYTLKGDRVHRIHGRIDLETSDA